MSLVAQLPSAPSATAAATRAYMAITSRWSLSEEEAVRLAKIDANGGTFASWKKGVYSITDDQLTRVSYVLGIYKALEIMFLSGDQADAWVRKPNRDFGGRPALEIMLEGVEGLATVRRYLDHVRGIR